MATSHRRARRGGAETAGRLHCAPSRERTGDSTVKTNLLAAIVLTATALIAGCSHQSKEEPAAASAEKSAEPQSRVKRGANGEVLIRLDAETQRVMGLQVAALAATQLQPEVKGLG